MSDDDKLVNDVLSEMKVTDTEEDTKMEFIQSPHFSSRRSTKIDTIIIHYTGANRISSTINWFKDPVSKVSAHYTIGRDGRIVQMVEDEKKAWHAGKSYFRGKYNVNAFSIGIEMVGTKDSGFTQEQYQAAANLCATLTDRYDIPLDRIVGHEDVSGDEAIKLGIRTESNKKIDPGPKWSWDTFHQLLSDALDKSVVDEEPEPTDDKENNKELYTPDKMMESGKDPNPESGLLKLLFVILRAFGITV